MDLVAEGIVQERVATQLGKAVRPRPVLHRADQGPPDAGAPNVCVDPPALQKGARGLIIAVGVASNAGFREAAQAAIVALGDKRDLSRIG